MLHIEVCYLGTQTRFLRALDVAPGCTIDQAIRASGVLDVIPGVTGTDALKVGIFSKPKPLDAVLRDHDRIEIYRPLIVDPMTARRARAQKKRR